MSSYRDIIAKNAAQLLHDGDFVNLGVGIPTLVSNYVPEGTQLILQGENGAAGIASELSTKGIYDDPETFLQWESTHKDDISNWENGHKDLLNAGSKPITLIPGACNFDICTSFAMLRGGHLDAAVLGAMQVDEEGNLANWMVPGVMVTGMGGAMDIAVGTKRVIIATSLLSKNKSPKLLKKCTLPLTAQRCVNTVVTEKCIIEITSDGFLVTALYPGVSKEEIIESIDAPVHFAFEIKEMLE